MSAVVPPGTTSAAGLPGGGWSGLWLSTSGGAAAGTSLKDVRTIIGASTGAAATLTGKGVGVAVIDTGVASVPGLPAAQIVNGPDLSFESQSNDLRYHDTYGHGTHMAGIIVANDTASGAKGIAPGAKLTSIKVGTANGAADVTQVIAAIDWVVANRTHDPANPIKVLNLSYGSGGNPVQWTDPLQLAVEQAWKAGILVVAAAGNQGASVTKLNNPANDQYVVAVGGQATKGTASVADDDMSAFTNYDSGRPLDILAPGESIASLRVPGSNIDNGFASARVGETLFKGSGTSQAAAVTSAAAALLFQQKPTLTPDQVKGHMVITRTWPTFNGNALKRGLGFLNVNAAVASIVANKPQTTQTWTQSTGAGKVEAARGNSHVVSDNVTLSGEKGIFGPFDSKAWAAKSKGKTAWAKGVWMGYRMAGDGWTGTSFASKTWAAGTWPGKSWGGAATWVDPAWTGRYWSGRYWSAGTWTGRYWSSDDWSSSTWD
jgi:serine protease AprX